MEGSVTTWNKAYDKILARMISYIEHTESCRQYCSVGENADCELGLFQDASFFQIYKIPNQLQAVFSSELGAQTFVPTFRMPKKQTAVPHSSAESEIISLDASFRKEDIPALRAATVVLCFIMLIVFLLDTFFHVPKQHSRKCTPSQTLHVREERIRHSYDRKRSLSPNETCFSNSPC